MLEILVIAVGVVVLAFGKRLSVLGAAVGALLGVVLLRFFPDATDSVLALIIPGLLAVIGFFIAGISKPLVHIILMVIGALAGASIALSFLELFNMDLGLLNWLVAVLGGVVGLLLVRQFSNWALIILAGLIGGLLITRGLSTWLTFLQDSLWGTLLVLVLAGIGIAYQSGFITKRRAAAAAKATAATPAKTAAAPAPAASPSAAPAASPSAAPAAPTEPPAPN